MNYTLEEIVSIAKRDNNPKRNFLIINAHQGKHFPAAPHQVFSFVEALAQKVFERTFQEPILIVGFAETATAIGAIVATKAPTEVNYIHTTRELLEEGSYLYFTEAHSHAMEQKLVKTDLEETLAVGTRILFAEDEVTTGNTIENIMAVLNQTYPHKNLKFGIVSLLNAMPEEKIEDLAKRDIPCYFMIRIPHCNFDEMLNANVYPEHLRHPIPEQPSAPYETVLIDKAMNPRNVVSALSYEKASKNFADTVMEKLNLRRLKNKKILVLGTEECMYPGLVLASQLEALGNDLTFHATTRSPMLPCEKEGYPIFCRHTLPSFYAEERTTFLYNLTTYDHVFVVSDTKVKTAAMAALSEALRENNCPNITQILWREA